MKRVFKDRVDSSFLAIVIIISLAFGMYELIHSTQVKPIVADENIITYHRAIGGEDIKVETVELSCFIGSSTGVADGEIWCNEIVVNQWSETDKNN